MKVVIIGSGKVGASLSYNLAKENNDVTVIDSNATAIKRVQNSQDVMCIEGDGADAEIQYEANVNKAGLMIATTPNDELNILCCLIAKRLGVKRTISRVRNPVYYKQMDLIKDDLGLSMVINPEFITADEIFRILMFPAAARIDVFAKGKMDLVEYRITEDSPLEGMTLAEVYKRNKIQFLICAVERDSNIFIPDGDFILHEGDRINIAASHQNLENFFRTIGVLKNKAKTVMIVGGSKICYYLTKRLLQSGVRVKIIENDYEKCQQLAKDLPKAVIIHGDGTEQELLEEEGISDVDAFISTTGMDEENIIMSLYAKNNSNAKIITKINRESYSEMATQMGLDCLIAPKQLTASSILSFVRSIDTTAGNNIEALYHIIRSQVEAIEFRVNSNIPELVGIPIKELKLKKNILICGIFRKRNVIIPNGDDHIEVGDSVIVISKDYRFSNLEDILD